MHPTSHRRHTGAVQKSRTIKVAIIIQHTPVKLRVWCYNITINTVFSLNTGNSEGITVTFHWNSRHVGNKRRDAESVGQKQRLTFDSCTFWRMISCSSSAISNTLEGQRQTVKERSRALPKQEHDWNFFDKKKKKKKIWLETELSFQRLSFWENATEKKNREMATADIKDGSILRIWMDTVSRQNISTPCDGALMFNQVWAKSICSACSQQTTHSASLASVLIIEV